MAPEFVTSLVAVKLRFVDDRLFGDGERIGGDGFYVSWYGTSQSQQQVPVAGGLVYIWATPALNRDEITASAPADLGDGRFKWRDVPPKGGELMFVMALPKGYTLGDSNPKPIEAKEYDGTIAVFWKLPPDTQVSLMWQLTELRRDLMDEVRRINQEGLDEMLPTRGGEFKYDVALSYASEDRAYVVQVATFLEEAGVEVFYDEFEEVDLWGEDLSEQLHEVYSKKARYTVLFISQYYVDKVWPILEHDWAQEHALENNILPARFDDAEVPGLSKNIKYISLHNREAKNFAELIVRKVRKNIS